MATRRTRRKAAQRTTKEAEQRPTQEAAKSSPPPTDLLDANEAMDLLKTTRPTFYRWLRTGKIKGLKVGRQWRFERAEIGRFLKGEEPRIELRADIRPLVRELAKRADQIGAKTVSLPDETDIQQAVAQCVRLGFGLRASDIHIHPHLGDDGTARAAVIRYRVDGVLLAGLEFDIRLLPAVIEQWKRHVACDPHESHRPQMGRMKFESGGEPVDVFVCFVPSVRGESLTARLLTLAGAVILLDRIDYAPADRARLLRALQGPRGLILVTGPAGCGKTTNLYACLNHVAGPTVKTMTVEDPVELVFPWMVQTQVNPSEGVTYQRAVRAVLRSDPDVIMIGELLDEETANLALQAAITGHLVLTTLHADDAVRALVRMVEMGCPPFVVGDATRLATSQRLVRLLCPDCSKKAEVPAEHVARAVELCRVGGVSWDSLPRGFRRPTGCAKCNQLGYRGRSIIAELLEVTPEIGQALRRGASADEMRAIAVGQGMTTLAADGVRKAAEGKTSLDEVLRVLPLETG
ncbi:MAG: Flp pilus assembly complex ATPase component TadA [Verrucomicrobia bacterium]|nr:Flp pilus assembly complex ATPase component TadA [Verrucomicrobiota bacterium]